MLQSFSGTIRVFPNTKNLGAGGFESLRAAGAFLVSAAWDGRAIASPVVLVSKKGATARIKKPWDKLRVVRTRDNRTIDGRSEGEVLEFPTDAGERYLLERL